MEIVYFAKGIRGEKCLEAMASKGESIIGVVANSDKDSSVTEVAKRLKLRIYQPKDINDESFIEEIRNLKPDLFVLSGYTQILKKELLSIPRQGTINLHGGKLPDYRGSSVINWQIIKGESTGGCSIIYVDEGIDTGDIIAQSCYDILPDDDAATVLEKTLKIFPKMLVEVLQKIKAGTIRRIPQDPKEGRYYPHRNPGDGRINWKTMTAAEVHNLVRALVKPYPGAFTYREDKKISVWKTSLLKEEIKGIPGRVAVRLDGGLVVMAANKGLLVEEISIEDSDEVINPGRYLRLGDDLN